MIPATAGVGQVPSGCQLNQVARTPTTCPTAGHMAVTSVACQTASAPPRHHYRVTFALSPTEIQTLQQLSDHPRFERHPRALSPDGIRDSAPDVRQDCGLSDALQWLGPQLKPVVPSVLLSNNQLDHSATDGSEDSCPDLVESEADVHDLDHTAQTLSSGV